MQPKHLSDRLYFDIETTVHPKADEFVGLKPLTPQDLNVPTLKKICEGAGLSVSGKKDMLIERAEKDPAAKEHLENTLKAELKTSREEALEKAPLDPDLGMIRAIGLASGDGPINVTVANENPAGDLLQVFGGVDGAEVYPMEAYYAGGVEAEKFIIEWFWEEAERHRLQLVGANILNFDLPFLLRRSMDLGIKVPVKLELRRFQVEPICDTMQILSHWGAFRYKSLKFMCLRYGIEIPMPDVDGSMVQDMDDPTLAQYTASDVWCTRELWKKMDGIYWPKIVNVPNQN
jgi:hypothetical protein